MIPQQMTLQIMTNVGRPRPLSGRGALVHDKVKLFFDELVGLPGRAESIEKSAPRKPRIIYIRDLPTLAPSSATWYPHLLAAVRQRRAGLISRPTAPISNTMTVIFGITPSITPSSHPSGLGGQGLINLLMSRNSPPSVSASSSKISKSEWNEDEAADKEREKRLRDRLRKWEKGDAALQEELPFLSSGGEQTDGGNRPRSGVVVIGGGQGGMSGLPPFLESALAGRSSENRDGSSDAESSRFFRTSVLVPSIRSMTQERGCRMSRRREINELTMRMGVGVVGGALEPKTEMNDHSQPVSQPGGTVEAQNQEDEMWEDWGKRIEVWTNVKQIADRAVGSVVAAHSGQSKDKSTLDPTPIPWRAIRRAWGAQRSSHDLRKAWTKESSAKTIHEEHVEDINEMTNEAEPDEVLERIKQDPELEQHEQRLLSCIVDSSKSVMLYFTPYILNKHSSVNANLFQSSSFTRPYHRLRADYRVSSSASSSRVSTGYT